MPRSGASACARERTAPTAPIASTRAALGRTPLRALALAFALTLASTFSSTASPSHDEAWLRLESGDLTVLYREDDARPAARMLEVASERSAVVARGVGLQHIGPLTIYVASSDQEYGELTSHGVPDWGVGCAFPRRGVVVLRSPLTVTYPLQMEDVVVHEMAHVAAGRVLGDVAVPRWFHEGVAMNIAGEWRLPQSSAQAGAGPGGRLIPLSDLSSTFPDGREDAALAYTESFYAVRYLMERAELGSTGEMLREIVAAGSFEDGVLALYGRGVPELQRDVMASFRGRFSWGVFLTRWNVLFVAIAVLVLAAGIVRMARARRKVSEWEAETAGLDAGRRSTRDRDSGWR